MNNQNRITTAVLAGITTVSLLTLTACAQADAYSHAVANSKRTAWPKLTTQEFVDIATRNDSFEIEAARYIVASTIRTDQEKYAYELMRDHTGWAEKIRAAAAQLTPPVVPNSRMTRAQIVALTTLETPFDNTLELDYQLGEVKTGQEELQLMQNYAKDGDAPALRDLANEIATSVQGYLTRAQQLNPVLDSAFSMQTLKTPETKSHYEGNCQGDAAALPVSVTVEALPWPGCVQQARDPRGRGGRGGRGGKGGGKGFGKKKGDFPPPK